uniref:Uncharacterized protein n=1 Tax=Chrysemys picta bellii TaxID=8478 RepID=A0A8C3IZT6_CHRPI
MRILGVYLLFVYLYLFIFSLSSVFIGILKAPITCSTVALVIHPLDDCCQVHVCSLSVCCPSPVQTVDSADLNITTQKEGPQAQFGDKGTCPGLLSSRHSTSALALWLLVH